MQAAFRALASSLHYLRGAFISIFTVKLRAIHIANPVIRANKVQAAFEYAKSSLHIFIYLIF